MKSSQSFTVCRSSLAVYVPDLRLCVFYNVGLRESPRFLPSGFSDIKFCLFAVFICRNFFVCDLIFLLGVWYVCYLLPSIPSSMHLIEVVFACSCAVSEA